MRKDTMFIIFIAGGSAAGKTLLSKSLMERLNGLYKGCIAIKLDDYYREMPTYMDLAEYKQTTNFDDPNILDFALLKVHILSLFQGKSIHKPIFDFKCERRVGAELVLPPDILLVDGTASLLFAESFMPKYIPSYKVFIEVDADILLKRRIQRDRLERGYADEMSIIKKDTDYVRPTFASIIEPTKKSADMVIHNHEIYDVIHMPNVFSAWIDKLVSIVDKD
ncbi:MAG: zeta toxin family protein [Legionellaceae bacterium]|nr:zeta toxin family protein [Legionellaceae bacterium]